MKKQLSYLVVGMFVLGSTSAFAALNYPDINISGDVSVKAIDVTNLDDFKDDAGTNINTIQSDLKLSLASNLADNVALSALLQKEIRNYGGPEDSVTGLQNDTSVKRANLKLSKIADNVDLTVGRQEVGQRFNSLVAYYYGADGIVANTAVGPVNLMVATAKTDIGEKDNLNILKASGKVMGIAVSGALYNLRPDVAINKTKVIDVTASGKIPVVCEPTYSVEYAKQDGKSGANKIDANAMLVKLNCGGFDTPVGAIKCGLTYLNTSGDKADTTKIEGFTGIRPSIKVTELASDMATNNNNDDDPSYTPVIGNLNAIILSVSVAATDALNLGLAYGQYKMNEATDKKIGSEINLTADYKQSDNISLALLVGQLTPGKGLSPNSDKATKIQAGMKVSF